MMMRYLLLLCLCCSASLWAQIPPDEMRPKFNPKPYPPDAPFIPRATYVEPLRAYYPQYLGFELPPKHPMRRPLRKALDSLAWVVCDSFVSQCFDDQNYARPLPGDSTQWYHVYLLQRRDKKPFQAKDYQQLAKLQTRFHPIPIGQLIASNEYAPTNNSLGHFVGLSSPYLELSGRLEARQLTALQRLREQLTQAGFRFETQNEESQANGSLTYRYFLRMPETWSLEQLARFLHQQQQDFDWRLIISIEPHRPNCNLYLADFLRRQEQFRQSQIRQTQLRDSLRILADWRNKPKWVQLRVLDSEGRPIKGAVVSVGSAYAQPYQDSLYQLNLLDVFPANWDSLTYRPYWYFKPMALQVAHLDYERLVYPHFQAYFLPHRQFGTSQPHGTDSLLMELNLVLLRKGQPYVRMQQYRLPTAAYSDTLFSLQMPTNLSLNLPKFLDSMGWQALDSVGIGCYERLYRRDYAKIYTIKSRQARAWTGEDYGQLREFFWARGLIFGQTIQGLTGLPNQAQGEVYRSLISPWRYEVQFSYAFHKEQRLRNFLQQQGFKPQDYHIQNYSPYGNLSITLPKAWSQERINRWLDLLEAEIGEPLSITPNFAQFFACPG